MKTPKQTNSAIAERTILPSEIAEMPPLTSVQLKYLIASNRIEDEIFLKSLDLLNIDWVLEILDIVYLEYKSKHQEFCIEDWRFSLYIITMVNFPMPALLSPQTFYLEVRDRANRIPPQEWHRVDYFMSLCMDFVNSLDFKTMIHDVCYDNMREMAV